MASNCEGCPLVEWKQCQIEELETSWQSGQDTAAALGAFMLAPLSEQIEDISSPDWDEAMKVRLQNGRPYVEAFLEHQAPAYAKSLRVYTKRVEKIVNRGKKIIAKAEATCDDPGEADGLTTCTGKGGRIYRSDYQKFRKPISEN